MATVGYYAMTAGQGLASQVDEITNNGDTAVNVTIPNATQLASLDSLYVVNESNGAFGAEYMANLGAISSAVNDGMNLIIFDRYVTNAQTILPGSGATVTTVRSFTSDIDVAAGAPSGFTNGPNGTIDDNTFDGGNYSAHGYVTLASLPAGAVPLLTTGDSSQIVAFTYPVGSGNVFYSTIPLDYYTGANNSAITPAEIFTLFGNTEEILCFTAGTLMTTAAGEQPVETLRIGDNIPVARGGTQTIRWISTTRVSARDLARNPKLRPVRITAGSLGNGLPKRDLLVSRQHRMLVRSRVAERMFGAPEALVSAIKLTALPGVYVDETVDSVHYVHILFDQHEIIMAEGAASESLFTGPEALKSVPAAARAELMQLFPELTTLNHTAIAAAHIPSGKLQSALVARHLKNAKAVYA
ncbi:Hint domain-containing protein [Lentibacter sp. XHP0401]|uniref:Hint domain-containing protein n=1 Tax=Lentibacter sp. XHP0401 TaxID=2984334 RepID=UPI0021E8D12F|nr:Hint domain-containing protein [Lentibacter sp. XHP0401]MCV2893623.1 Hint domain-containing protein [Lentibacter sp. XHP0401]